MATRNELLLEEIKYCDDRIDECVDLDLDYSIYVDRKKRAVEELNRLVNLSLNEGTVLKG